MTDKLNHLFEICGINDFEFTYQKEGDKNFITHSLNPNKILVNISNIDDEDLEKLLDDKIKELKETFK
jgi:formiminotetrahydrofolate cyclodeaminase